MAKSTEFTCIAIKNVVNNGERVPEERRLYQDLFKCEYKIFEQHFEESFQEEKAKYFESEEGVKEYGKLLKETRVMALLLAGEILSDQ